MFVLFNFIDNETEDMMEGIRSGYLMQISDLTEQLNNYENASEKERNSVIQYYENKLSGLSEKFTRVNTDNQMAHQEIDIIKSVSNQFEKPWQDERARKKTDTKHT